MVSCFCHRPSAGSPSSPEKQPVPIPVLPALPQPAKLAPQRAVVDDSVPARPCTPPPCTSTLISTSAYSLHREDSSTQQSPSRCPIPKIPDFEGLVDSGTDSDDELLQLARTNAAPSTALPATGMPGPSTPKRPSATGGAGGCGTDSSSMSPLSSLMSRIGSIGRGSPSQATGPCDQMPEAVKSTDNLAIATHRAEVRRLTHKRMQEELQKERQPYPSHAYKRSTMSTIKEDAADASPRGSPTKQQQKQQQQPLAPNAEYDVVENSEDRAISRKLKKNDKNNGIFLSQDPGACASGPVSPRAFALQGNTRVKLPQRLVVRGRRSSRSKGLRDWVRSSFGADQPDGDANVEKIDFSTQMLPVPNAEEVLSEQAPSSATSGGITEKRPSVKDSSEETPGSLSSLDEDGSIHEACKARVVTSGMLSTPSVHPLSGDSASWTACGDGSRQSVAHPSLSRTHRHDRGSSDASRISTLDLPSPFLNLSLAPEGESRRMPRRTRGSSSHDDSIQLSLPNRYFDYAAALEAAEAANSDNEDPSRISAETLADRVSGPQNLVGDLEKMSDDWHRQISLIQKGSPVCAVPFNKMRLSQTWPHAMQPPSFRVDQQIEPEDPFQTTKSGFDVFKNPVRALDGSLVDPAARRQRRRDRHTMALDTRDMDTAWWADVNNNPVNLEGTRHPSDTSKDKFVGNACFSDQKEVVDIVPTSTVHLQAELPEEPPVLLPPKPATTGFEKVIRSRLKKVLARKQGLTATEHTLPAGHSILSGTSSCDRDIDQVLEGQSTIVEASQSARQSSKGLSLDSENNSSEMAAELSEKDCPQQTEAPSTPVSKQEAELRLGSEKTYDNPLLLADADADADTFKDTDSIFGVWVNLQRTQDTAPATPVKTAETKSGCSSSPEHIQHLNHTVPSTPVASAYAEVRAYISGAFSSPQVPRAVAEVQNESPSSSYKDAVSSHDMAAPSRPVPHTTWSKPGDTFSLKSDLALPKLALDSAAPSSKYNTWNGRANPNKPRLMKSTVQFGAELESIFLGKNKKRDSREGKENKENVDVLRDSMSRALSGHD